MAISVETFEMEEVTQEQDSNREVEEAALDMIRELGLKGQENLISRRQNSPDDQNRIPFRRMQKDEVLVYQILCPQRFRLEDYDAQPIPFRVLAKRGWKSC